MRRLLAVLVLALAGNAWSQVLLSDSFEERGLGNLRWNSYLPFPDSSLATFEIDSDGNINPIGYLRAVNRGTIFTRQGFSSPYVVSGIFKTASLFDVTTIDLRSDGERNPNNIFGGINGLSVTFWSPANYWGVGGMHIYNSDGGEPFASTYARSFSPNIEYTFSILDTGDALTIDVTGSDISPFNWVVPTTFSAGSKVGFGSRHSHMGQTGVTDFLEVQISVPEPSSVSLLLVGGLVALARRKRPKTPLKTL
jgi:hypothetical protein